MVTGLVIAVKGHQLTSGDFEVHDWTFATDATATPAATISMKEKAPRRLVGFVSALRIGSPDLSPTRLRLLRDFLLGAAGGPSELQLASHITRLVVVGDSLTAAASLCSQESEGREPKGTATTVANCASVLDEADVFFSQLAAAMPVDVMPGPNDPTTYMLPQQPLHPSLFVSSRHYASFQSTTNPYSFEMDGTAFLGHSGQPVKDVMAFTSFTNPLDALVMTVKAECIAPTAPDSLCAYPFVEVDPFTLQYDRAHFTHLSEGDCEMKIDDVSERDKTHLTHPSKRPDVVFCGAITSPSTKQTSRGEDNDVTEASEVRGDSANEVSEWKQGSDTRLLNNEEGGWGPLCIYLPDFSSTGILTLVDVDSLTVEKVTFG
eukprot:GHVN01032237.1.p1 GENE.GHVN01032237.1~~GHVN01032237.1.p1  ORF type:complete len:376 (-),score=116.30 GHVN01032237.1:158-1285(-)